MNNTNAIREPNQKSLGMCAMAHKFSLPTSAKFVDGRKQIQRQNTKLYSSP